MRNDACRPFVPPPPPVTGSSLYTPDQLEAKTRFAESEARDALILSIVGLFCFGFIFGILGFRKANSALSTIDLYEVARDKRAIAMTAKVLSIIDIVGWALMLVARLVLR